MICFLSLVNIFWLFLNLRGEIQEGLRIYDNLLYILNDTLILKKPEFSNEI